MLVQLGLCVKLFVAEVACEELVWVVFSLGCLKPSSDERLVDALHLSVSGGEGVFSERLLSLSFFNESRPRFRVGKGEIDPGGQVVVGGWFAVNTKRCSGPFDVLNDKCCPRLSWSGLFALGAVGVGFLSVVGRGVGR